MQILRRQFRLIARLALACGALACSDPTSPSNGQLINVGINQPAWSADGREIFHYTTGRVAPTGGFLITLAAVNAASGAVRTLASTMGTNTGGDRVVAPQSGNYVFFAVGVAIGPHYIICRVPAGGGQIDTIAADARWPWFQVSNDGRRVAYQSGVDARSPGAADTLKVVDSTRPFGPVVRAAVTTFS